MRHLYTDSNGDNFTFSFWNLSVEQRKRYNTARRYSLIHNYLKDGKPWYDSWMWSEEEHPDIMNNKYLSDDIKIFMSKIVKLMAFA